MFSAVLKIAFALSVTAFVLTCAAAAQAQDLEAGLVGYWTFDKADTKAVSITKF